ncbi:hypothetical protein SAMN05216214_10250 [Atopomonas hussainii]|uniref:Uncharacterized protein n=1 Tax=Atopomonas hussainii TaxID=1429083 RepID=A0A1H7GK97_9GAMM|nr:hypothetical protein SAMN05216214_10250 [Atopomonas hussainii]
MSQQQQKAVRQVGVVAVAIYLLLILPNLSAVF